MKRSASQNVDASHLLPTIVTRNTCMYKVVYLSEVPFLRPRGSA